MTLFSYSLLISAILIILFIYLWLTYNSVVRQKIRVRNEYSNIDVQLNRRSSLLQNLADMVKAYAKHEKETFENVAKARSAVEQSKNATDFAKAQNLIDNTVRSLNIVVENYPELKASENYRDLQTQFSNTENIIAVYREEYNKSVLQYNTLIQTFPNVIVSVLFDFKPAYFFQANLTQDNVVKL